MSDKSKGSYAHQDWNVVTLRKKDVTCSSTFSGPKNRSNKSKTVSSNQQRKVRDNAKQIADAEEAQKITTVSHSLAQTIAQSRNGKGWTQKQLAMKINEPQSLIADYEAGRAIPNNQILGKLERVLNVKLRGINWK